jgi:hypothetical protein
MSGLNTAQLPYADKGVVVSFYVTLETLLYLCELLVEDEMYCRFFTENHKRIGKANVVLHEGQGWSNSV